jgi:SAM-dependent methyltransferase
MTPADEYRRFWHDVGETFPDLGGAASTSFYRANEERLIAGLLGPLHGARVLKTDLWDEARNTRILQWVAAQGARVTGIDISPPIARAARAELGADVLDAIVADVRRLPFADASFDGIYSMGTVEHFDETEAALAEIRRVLKPGGRAIVGVPNRHDPFLRPLLVALLNAFGWYGYGFEKSYSRRRLREMLEGAGFEIVDETGILFMPGWLRMADLAAHAWCRPLTMVTAPAVRVCAWVDARVPRARRHGYLLATVVTRASTASAAHDSLA